ncbi:STAS domain-containing protein [Amycolatopsis sp. OK19-0408]|uniref:Anti-sigma factor antagonist n=1 Tax=Amycolatopsis iheyensis TaxID=2945988 RepID=A0A9X2NEU4_9PSEU|nr:STAS domain-containing protein [Amycolatopsis iheyensis]MCR6485570.1 STAS domain-containing protein [Amycolatopsis iheyensis]
MTDEPTLRVRVHSVPEAVVVVAEGDLDLGSAPTLRGRSRAVLADRPGALIVDLGGIAFCGSAGLQVLAELAAVAETGDVPFAVVADRHSVLRVLRLTRLDEVVQLHRTVDAARDWLRRRPPS